MTRGLLLLAVLYRVISASAQPASDPLQSGIYGQDTIGDLDAAIRIYRQILDSGTGVRLYAAHAQYRQRTASPVETRIAHNASSACQAHLISTVPFNSPRRVQKYAANSIATPSRAAPNSPPTYLVRVLSIVRG